MSLPAAIATVPGLFAAGIDWLEAILPILFVGFWILSQVFAIFRRVAGGPARPPVVRVPDLARDEGPKPRPPARPEGDPRAELDRQIADFLRQVTGEAPQETPARPRSQSPSHEPEPARQRSETPPLPKQSAPVAQRPRPAAPRPRPAAQPAPAAGARHVGTLDMQPSDVARHVEDAFAHELGHLHSGLERPGDEPAQAERPRPAIGGRVTARDLVTAARDPATIRQAILLREILERPADRW
jgi:hypothetical protein